MQRTFKPIFLVTALMLIAASAAIADVNDKTLKIGRQELSSEATEMGIAVLDAAYKKIGAKVQYVRYPPRRASMLMQSRALDGEVMRIAEYEKTSKSLIRISTPINFVKVVIFARPPCPQIHSWADLKNLKTGYQRGIFLFEENLLPAQRKEYRGYPEVFEAILRKEVDVGVGFLVETKQAMRQLSKKSLCEHVPEMEPIPVYHYLDQRHQALADQLESTLKQMEKKGDIKKILEAKRTEILSM